MWLLTLQLARHVVYCLPQPKSKQVPPTVKKESLLLYGFSLQLIHLLWIPLQNCLFLTKTQAGEPLPHPTLCMGSLNVVLSTPHPIPSLIILLPYQLLPPPFPKCSMTPAMSVPIPQSLCNTPLFLLEVCNQPWKGCWLENTSLRGWALTTVTLRASY